MEAACRNEGCTFSATSICVLGNDPKDCPERVVSSEQNLDLNTDAGIDDPSPVDTALKLPSGLVLGKEDVSCKMSRSYCQLVGILGSPGAGKTAALVSLYLLLAHRKLANFHTVIVTRSWLLSRSAKVRADGRKETRDKN